ncbi:RagB/SusD family nutrient uptake outer membrane protein [Pseudoflavitalea rhizosphaerae]|uniref:RagB/SusD family nutrient uptake outer membrane protein n=1 Tax=Pseudoflavitalea rhizosphaerae TaxID=1884793 RepID=UPI000F8EC5D3|nr:RagB/SusD family nutrient uptake outer membrane protein [Pseudoflavitalea rhizosphaerae]
MKLTIYSSRLLMVGVVCATLFTACKKDDFLEVPNTGAVDGATAYATESSADLVLNDVYSNLPDLNNFIFEPFDSWTDDLMTGFNWNISSQTARNKTTINPSTVLFYDWSSATMWLDWGTLYSRVRKCNVFIQGVEESTTLSQDFKDKKIAEARVLRAFFYHQLWMLYGGVPIITKPDRRDQDGDAIFHPRAGFDETFQFLQTELGEAAAALPANNGNDGKGKITKGAALTIKGWVEVFFASKRNNPTNDKTRWATAAATNKQVMQLGYALYPKYDELFFTTGNANNEGILYREYLTIKKGSNIIGYQGPNNVGARWLSWGGSTPTQELVDEYAMANGMAIDDPGSGYDEDNPYANREPRFKQSILYNGNTFNGEVFLSAVGSGNNSIDLADATDNTNTGYCTKKRMDTTVNIFQGGTSAQNYYYFRYAEVLLNYAEAQNEAVGPDASVYAALDEVRTRAGIPTFTDVYPGATQDEMRQLIRRERRVELAFEGKRYFDLIRWEIAEVNLNHVMHGMKITGSPGAYTYERINAVPSGAPQWKFDKNKNYLLPIPLSAIGRNPAMKDHQNPGYQ